MVDKTLYIAGQIGWDISGNVVGGIEEQTKLALENMGHVLEAAGASHKNGMESKSIKISSQGNNDKMSQTFRYSG